MRLNMLFPAALALAGVAATGAAAQTISFANTDIEGLEELQREYGPFRDVLEEITGHEIEFFPVSGVDPLSRTGFGFGRARRGTVGLMGGFELGG